MKVSRSDFCLVSLRVAFESGIAEHAQLVAVTNADEVSDRIGARDVMLGCRVAVRKLHAAFVLIHTEHLDVYLDMLALLGLLLRGWSQGSREFEAQGRARNAEVSFILANID